MALALVVSLAALADAAPASPGGPWSHNHPPVYCSFTGFHGAWSGDAHSQTEEYSGTCSSFRQRLKFQRTSDGAILATTWYESSASSFTLVAPFPSTAVASEHRAYNGFGGTWSAVRRPHAW